MPQKSITIICGGVTGERGISLNSARSLYDNLDKDRYELSLIYFNPQLQPYKITPAQVYSNTPLDFDYKLKHEGQVLGNRELKQALQAVDLVFPAIHGLFGEDGQLQKILEKYGVKYLGSNPEACRNTSDKHLCQQILQDNGFYTVDNWVVKDGDPMPDIPTGKYVAKPLHGGSSLGVQYVNKPQDMAGVLKKVFALESEALIEPFCIGKEFTIIVLENSQGKPVALLPTEMEFTADDFFSYRKKYLPSTDTRYHTPARFNQKDIKKIRQEAERAFQCLGMRDFARLDGWLLEDGTVWLSDINAISGMEQNSFLFQQPALLGLSHTQLLDYLINKKTYPPSSDAKQRELIPVIFGGGTTERQVSTMSGTNAYMKLKSSAEYQSVPLFLTAADQIYQVPHFLCLHHTADEIAEKVKQFQDKSWLESLQASQEEIWRDLDIEEKQLAEPLFIPKKISLEGISKKYKFLFLGLHGGEGEDGTLQAKLDDLKLPYNGPGAACSQLCMDKYLTGQKVMEANIEGVKTARRLVLNIGLDVDNLWQNLQNKNFKAPLVLKPRGDGCSAGVIRINNYQQFATAIKFFKSDEHFIPAKAISPNHERIDLPDGRLTELLVEECIITDKIFLENLEIKWPGASDIIEITIGVIGKQGQIHAFNPSQTIVSSQVLSLEEKFMGGTGINLTPPPAKYVKPEIIKLVRTRVETLANYLGIEGYARVDAFMNIKTGELTIIEINTLPALTPSTALFHQALQEERPVMPLQLMEKFIKLGKERL